MKASEREVPKYTFTILSVCKIPADYQNIENLWPKKKPTTRRRRKRG